MVEITVIHENECGSVLGLAGWPWVICRRPKGHYGQQFMEVHNGETGTATVSWRDEDEPNCSVYATPGVYHWDTDGVLRPGALPSA